MKPLKKVEILNKLIAYILGSCPDEFGLCPDNEGYVKIKDLISALNEEPGYAYVRKASLNEVLVSAREPSISINGNMVRAVKRDSSFDKGIAEETPKLLYTCIRKRALEHSYENGINPLGRDEVVMAKTRELAEKIGKRLGPFCTLIINTSEAKNKGVAFNAKGALLFSAPFIPPGCFSGPPLPKKKPEEISSKPKPEKPKPPTPGSFFLEPEEPVYKKNKVKGRKKRGWKEDARKERKKRGY